MASLSEKKEVFRTFEDLQCWKKCRALRIFVRTEIIKMLPKDEKYRLGDQLIRASRSATAKTTNN